jgi:hypothetical protein
MNKHPARMFVLVALCSAAPVAQGFQERPVSHPELLAGAWEGARAGGVDGIFLSISTHEQGATGQPETSSQNIHIRLYHREAGNETGGWYTARSSGTRDEPAVFDGEHLRLRAVSDGPIIDVRFDPGKQRWTGTWTRGGQSQDIILERPHGTAGATANPLVGDWEGLPDSVATWRAATRLHISESGDGVLTAWLDRIIAPIDQRHGELLQVAASENRTIILTTTPPAGMRYTFRGALSSDGSTLAGTWQSISGTGGTLNAATNFRRTP